MGRTARRTRDAPTGLSDGTGTDQGKKLVGGGSYRDHRGRDCCGHAAVKSGGWDGRGGHTEERGAGAPLCALSLRCPLSACVELPLFSEQ